MRRLAYLLTDMPFFDVAAVVGPLTSSMAVATVPFLNNFNIPVFGMTTSTDQLDDRTSFPFFARLVSPDKYQVLNFSINF